MLRKTQKKFGSHTHIFSGYGKNSYPYFTVAKTGIIDGIGTEHLDVFAECDICFENIVIGRIHKPKKILFEPRIRAIFIGTNGSLGYINGKTYYLDVTTNRYINIKAPFNRNTQECYYESIKTFEKNWKVI